jgi:ribonucleoside-diphosphate reductase alpha chain
MINRYFIPNSPCLVNSGKQGGKMACFVVDFKDTIEDIYKTKLDFALIARKGGGCGTTLTKIRPKNSTVNGSSHGYAGGPIAFADTISHDMEALTQSGFRSMAIMFTMSVYHKDILDFISAKETDGKISNANISVVVDDEFMRKVENNENYTTFHDFDSGGVVNRVYYDTYNAREVFSRIVEHAWKNGEPGLLFLDRMNDSPYKYVTDEKILSTNPCSEQPLLPNLTCNLGSIDLSKLVSDGKIDLDKLNVLVRLGVRFLDSVIDHNSYPTKEIEEKTKEFRPIGVSIMGLADLFLSLGIAYGSKESVDLTKFVMKFIKDTSEDESAILGQEKGISLTNQKLPFPRRNITVTTVAPTGTVSLIAGCSSGIECIFSEITIRNDKTGTYQFMNVSASSPHFRCAVAANGATEVTPEEHLAILAAAQEYVDSGVSKTVNLPNHAHKETVYNVFMKAWKTGVIKGLTVYRNGSRKQEVLSPKNLKKDKCPNCGNEVTVLDGKKKCSKCSFEVVG